MAIIQARHQGHPIGLLLKESPGMFANNRVKHGSVPDTFLYSVFECFRNFFLKADKRVAHFATNIDLRRG